MLTIRNFKSVPFAGTLWSANSARHSNSGFHSELNTQSEVKCKPGPKPYKTHEQRTRVLVMVFSILYWLSAGCKEVSAISVYLAYLHLV